MIRLNLIIFIFICIGLINVFSQKISNPEKVSISDFSIIGDKSVCFWYNSVISFPYAYSDRDCGAKDYLFSLENETYMRIILNRNDTSSMFLAVPKFYNSRPKLISASYYYLNNNDIVTQEIKDSRIKFVYYFDKGFYFDLSSFKGNDDNVIIDLQYSYPIESKKVIKISLDNKLNYKFIGMRLDIPEIYSYKFKYSQKYLTMKTDKQRRGPIIGWNATNVTSYSHFSSKKWFDDLPKSIPTPDGQTMHINRTLVPFLCNINPVTFNSKEFISIESDDAEDNFNEIVTLSLARINEIRP